MKIGLIDMDGNKWLIEESAASFRQEPDGVMVYLFNQPEFKTRQSLSAIMAAIYGAHEEEDPIAVVGMPAPNPKSKRDELVAFASGLKSKLAVHAEWFVDELLGARGSTKAVVRAAKSKGLVARSTYHMDVGFLNKIKVKAVAMRLLPPED